MAASLSIDFQISDDCKKFTIINNHNHDGGNVTNATVDVFRNNSKIKSSLSVSVSDAQNNNDIELTTQDISGTSSDEVFQDGVYQIRLNITYNSSNTFSTNDRNISYCNAHNCIVSKVGTASEENCECEDRIVEDTWDLYMMLQGAIYKFSCGDYTKAASILDRANKLCDADCGCS